jgi:C4-dicarboxylate-specific signal transduction histidine kinase
LAELEKQRALDDRLSLLGRLVADVAHELRNPLTYVTANVTLLREGIDQGAVSEALTDVETGLSRISGLIDDLRAFARNEPEPLGACDLGPIIEEALRISSVRLSAIATVQQAISPGLPLVTGSARRLVQVLVNLLINAADALEDAPAPRQVRVTAREDGGAVLLCVEDNGPGIAPEIRDRLFTPFSTTKGTKGTGLGLSLSREYLSSFRATIEAGQSELGGARFALRLPKAVVALPR